MPLPAPRGRTREVLPRGVVNAVFCMAQTGCQWRMPPKEVPPCSTVQRYFYAWRDDGRWQTINHVLLVAVRAAAGRQASPSAAVIDSESVKTTEACGTRGFDAGKKVKGRKRHILTDTIGPLVRADQQANSQGSTHGVEREARDGAPSLLAGLASSFAWLRHVSADTGHAGDKLKDILVGLGNRTIEITKRPRDARGFVLLPRRWVVERTFAIDVYVDQPQPSPRQGLRGHPRLVCIASVKLMSRRLARA